MQDGGRDDQQSEQSRNHRREETTPRQQPHSERSTNDLKFDWQEPPDTTFEDVGGYETVKDELREDVISPYVNDSAGYERFQVTPDRGILFHGPPGTGKTLFARALAHELQRPYVELSQSQLTSKWINEGPDLIDHLFTEAQQLRAVVFIDEAESLLGSRDDGLSSNREDAKTTNTFLNKLSQDDQEFFVVLTTNRKDRMDDAVLRPGRVDKHVEIPVPDLDARYEILKTQLEDVPSDLDVETMREMARELDGASGADIEQVVADARRSAAKQNSSALRRHHFDLDILDA
jgi:SpoVK/Ycf46/Vps4 family AAA+-type ATPase